MYHSSKDARVVVLFGNGETRYDEVDSTAQIAVELVRQRIDDLGVMELGFGLDSEASSTWAIIVEVPGRVIDEQRLERLRDALKEAYRIAREQE